MKELLMQRIVKSYKEILERKKLDWSSEAYYAYVAGVSNTLTDLSLELHEQGLLTDDEADEVEELFCNTFDTL